MTVRVIAVDRPELAPLEMPSRFKHDIAYFMTPSGERGAPQLAEGEYWIDPGDVRGWLDSGVLVLVSPLDSQNAAEVEITEEQEQWLEWLVAHGVERVRLEP
jgi:hypothetical protein